MDRSKTVAVSLYKVSSYGLATFFKISVSKQQNGSGHFLEWQLCLIKIL